MPGQERKQVRKPATKLPQQQKKMLKNKPVAPPRNQPPRKFP